MYYGERPLGWVPVEHIRPWELRVSGLWIDATTKPRRKARGVIGSDPYGWSCSPDPWHLLAHEWEVEPACT